MNPELQSLFVEEYRALRPRAPIPFLEVSFRRFTSLNTTIRLREGRVHVHLSDLLEGAPESVLRAIAHILLAKLYRKPMNSMIYVSASGTDSEQRLQTWVESAIMVARSVPAKKSVDRPRKRIG